MSRNANSVPKCSNVDVLIIGAGPAGLMAADWFARLGVDARIVEKRTTKILNGHADGISTRSMEIFESCGFSHRILEESVPYYELVTYVSTLGASAPALPSTLADANKIPDERGIKRDSVQDDTMGGTLRFPQHILGQSYIETAFLSNIGKNSNIEVEYGKLPVSFSINERAALSQDAYPVTVTIQQLLGNEAATQEQRAFVADQTSVLPQQALTQTYIQAETTEALVTRTKARTETQETIQAKYLIACEGAHSWTRRQLGLGMEGQQTSHVWGVMDIIPITDFPDIRRCCFIQSKVGSMLVIPRERKLVRIYTQVLTDESGNSLGPLLILTAARSILTPYTLDFKTCDWWTSYCVGQRVCTAFSDPSQRIFLAGDAVHVHSPMAAQGMNTSLQDTFNLGWKIGGVVQGKYPRDILATYQFERRAIAQQLIEFDEELTRVSSGNYQAGRLNEMHRTASLFVHGHGILYRPSMITATPSQNTPAGEQMLAIASNSVDQAATTPSDAVAKAHLATGVQIGMRLPDFQVLGQADARPYAFLKLLVADGLWRLIVFAGDISDPAQMSRVNTLGDRLSRLGSIISCHISRRTSDGRLNGEIEVLTLHCGPRSAIKLADFHPAFVPCNEWLGLDYEKVFADAGLPGLGGGVAYDGFGVNKQRGCLVLTRPDQYVSWIGELDDVDDLESFIEPIMVR